MKLDSKNDVRQNSKAKKYEKNIIKTTSAEKTKVTIVIFCFKFNLIAKLFAQIGLNKMFQNRS